MIDIETLDTTPTSVVLTIAGIRFDPRVDYGWIADPTELDFFYCRVKSWHVGEGDIGQSNRTISESTKNWWSSQDADVRAEAFNPENRLDLSDAMKEFNAWASGGDRYWANGISFDMPILESCNRDIGFQNPWQYWQCHDARTIYKLVPDHNIPSNSKHHALWDCLNQIQRLTDCFNRLGVYPNK